MYQAYKDGRTDKDPTEFWYKGEIGFFDFYMWVVLLMKLPWDLRLAARPGFSNTFSSWRLLLCSIPLAKKLKECGVFGVSSDEYLNYAMKNRKEWQQRGMQVMEEYVEAVKNMK